jgi:hypothetical protein
LATRSILRFHAVQQGKTFSGSVLEIRDLPGFINRQGTATQHAPLLRSKTGKFVEDFGQTHAIKMASARLESSRVAVALNKADEAAGVALFCEADGCRRALP